MKAVCFAYEMEQASVPLPVIDETGVERTPVKYGADTLVTSNQSKVTSNGQSN